MLIIIIIMSMLTAKRCGIKTIQVSGVFVHINVAINRLFYKYLRSLFLISKLVTRTNTCGHDLRIYLFFFRNGSHNAFQTTNVIRVHVSLITILLLFSCAFFSFSTYDLLTFHLNFDSRLTSLTKEIRKFDYARYVRQDLTFLKCLVIFRINNPVRLFVTRPKTVTGKVKRYDE